MKIANLASWMLSTVFVRIITRLVSQSRLKKAMQELLVIGDSKTLTVKEQYEESIDEFKNWPSEVRAEIIEFVEGEIKKHPPSPCSLTEQ